MAAMAGAFTINIFSNVAASDPARNYTLFALRSALSALRLEAGAVTVRVFVDPAPHPQAFDGWIAAAREASPVPVSVHRSAGLADGYAASLETCETAHALQLEHDFVLLPRRIHHGAFAITDAMARAHIVYLRFNKRWNRPSGTDAFMTPQRVAGLPCCRVPGRSNNPHIIDVEDARRTVLPLIDRRARKAEGLEGVIDQYVGGGHVYGGLGHRATCGHLDGRHVRRTDAAFRRRHLAGAS